jgi:tRNA nucleotidyltransferase (CCA-adding enzyme)
MARSCKEISLESIPEKLRLIMTHFLQNGFEVWLVGGALRDLLLGWNPKDWDLATSASPQQVIELFPRVIPLGLRHGTVQIHCDNEIIEVTSCPTAGPEGILADLQRRDFTANALAFSYPDGQLLDPFGGQRDILSQTLRSVGDAGSRFSEDPLRTLRAGRFLSVYGFNVEPDTFAAIQKVASGLQRVSFERIREEFFKMLLGKYFTNAFNEMMRGGVIQQFLPELAAQAMAILTDLDGASLDLIEHSIDAVQCSPFRLRVRLAALFHHLGDLDLEQFGRDSLEPQSVSDKSLSLVTPAEAGVRNTAKNLDSGFRRNDLERPQWPFWTRSQRRFRKGALAAAAIMQRLRTSRRLEQEVAFLVENQVPENLKDWTKAEVRFFIASVDEGLFEDVMDLASADGKARKDGYHRLRMLRNLRLRIYRELRRRPPLRIADLAISGRDVMRVLNLEPGPAVGEVIRRLHREVLEHPALNHPKILMDFLRKEYHIESRIVDRQYKKGDENASQELDD